MLAEQLSPDDVWRYNHPEGSGVHEQLCDASATLELVLCRPPANVGAAIDIVGGQLKDCTELPGNDGYRARLLIASMPLFEARAQRKEYDAAVMSQVYRNLGNLAIDLPLKGPNGVGTLYEVLGIASGMRTEDTDFAITPATVRERNSRKRRASNHSSYTIERGQQPFKIPLQLRGGVHLGGCRLPNTDVERVYMRDGICSAARDIPRLVPAADLRYLNIHRPPAEAASALLDFTARLIHVDAAGQPISEPERLFLSRLSDRVVAAIRRRRSRL